MRWTQGRQEIDRLLADDHLERVPPNRKHADLLMAQARRHLASASKLTDDPEAGYAVLYDAARKALWAILANQGLRPTTRGSHLTAYQAVLAQLHPPLGEVLRPFDRIRRERRSAEYPNLDDPSLTAEDVVDDLPKVAAIVDVADRVLDRMSPY
ncbi:HEPN domain-containing protein [Klenkia sp. LSe6-5]|uniref:HEPN domain-containing protein n=1 Tax=Klenkia sesuvii TaxID=3103137 RepID=A0ABU8E078_9ACTN